MNDEGESPPTASYGLALSDAATASTLLPGPTSAPAVIGPAASRLSAAAHSAPSRLSAAPATLAVPGLSQALMPIIESPDRQGLPNVLPWDLPQALDVQGRTKARDNSGESCASAVIWHRGAWPQPRSALTGTAARACCMPVICTRALPHVPSVPLFLIVQSLVCLPGRSPYCDQFVKGPCSSSRGRILCRLRLSPGLLMAAFPLPESSMQLNVRD